MKKINQNKKSFTFIGMSGVGKSTFGKKIAKKFDYSFTDTDTLIEHTLNIKISDYIQKNGEAQFLNIEEKIICSSNFPAPHIISTGGSVIYSTKIMTYLKEVSTIIFLDDSIDNIKKRIKTFSNRGVVMNQTQSIEELYNQRLPLYKKFADLIIQLPEPFTINKGEDLIDSRLRNL